MKKMLYIIKSLVYEDYFVGIEPMKNNNYKLFWSQYLKEAKRFNTYKKASETLVFVHGLIEEEIELVIVGVEEDEEI